MNAKIAWGASVALVTGALNAAAAPVDVVIPKDFHMPDITPLVEACADPAADHFLEIDISQRAPADATKVQKVSGWVTADGIFHWPFVMRMRNVGDRTFVGKPGKQRVVVTEDDLLSGKKDRVVATVPFDRADARSGAAARFLFEAPAADMNKERFHRVYTLTIKYDVLDQQTLGQYGDCDLTNNSFAVEFDGSRKGWIRAK